MGRNQGNLSWEVESNILPELTGRESEKLKGSGYIVPH
jgi:hypothetical protein